MKYYIQLSLLKYLYDSKLITEEELVAAEAKVKRNLKSYQENFKKDLTNRNYNDILLTVDKNSQLKK